MEVNKHMTQEEILNYIYDGMPHKLRNAICVAGPKDYYELITIGKRLESVSVYDIEDKAESKKNDSDDTKKMLEMLMKEINHLKMSTNNQGRPNNCQYNQERRNNPDERNKPRFPRNANGGVVCYTCGKNGHVSRFCYFNGETNQNRDIN